MMKDKISLDKYMENVKEFWKQVKEKLMVDAKDNEVYQVYNICRKNFLKYNIEYSGVFKQINSIYKLIYRAWDNSLSELEDVDEDIDDICYWSINKYRLTDGEYEQIFRLNQSSNEYLDFEFNYKIQSFGNEDEKILYKEWNALNSTKGINFDFQCGDIIQVSAMPIYAQENKEYFIYHKDDGVFKRDFCGELRYGSISRSNSQYGFRSFVPCYIKKVQVSDDETFNKLSKIIGENSDMENKKIIDALNIREKDSFFEHLDRAKELERRIIAGEDISNI